MPNLLNGQAGLSADALMCMQSAWELDKAREHEDEIPTANSSLSPAT
ncbi:hypothetical protein [Novosphingobium malaysiense]|nr:hypothetical protein [Novosphingobium malaysiense]